MELSKYALDLVLVPLSLCLTAGYHAYVYRSFTSEGPLAAVGVSRMRKTWFQTVVKENSKKGMLGVQSVRNSLMSAILSASVAILLNSSLAVFSNNVFNAGRLLHHPMAFGNQTGPLLVLKYASASLLLLLSFLCSSAAVGCVIEANFLLNVPGDFFHGRARAMLERGFLLASVGSRLLYVTLSFLLWLFGPLPLAASSVALVWLLYNLDFVGVVGVGAGEDEVYGGD